MTQKTPLTDEQIDAIFGDSPFIARRKMDKSGYEVVQQTNDDWRECIPNDDWKHHGDFATYNEAEEVRRRLHVRWVEAASAQPLVGERAAQEVKSLAENYARWLCKFQIEGGADRKAEAAASARQQLYSAIDALAFKQPAAASERPQKVDHGHGHVWPRPDGYKARCGGPAICRVCALDAASKAMLAAAPSVGET